MAGTSPLFIGQLFFMATVLLAALAVGVAILRYRLYEIDLSPTPVVRVSGLRRRWSSAPGATKWWNDGRRSSDTARSVAPR